MRTGTVSYKLEDLKKGVIIPIGFVGENDFTKVFFDAEEIYKKYPNASVSMKVQSPKGGIYPATVTRDGNTVIWQVKEADVANRGGGELQLTFTDGEMKIKTYIAKTDVKRSLAGNGPAPDPVQDWIDDADEKLAEVDDALEDLAAMDNIAKNAKASDIGKALSPKTVEDGVVTEWEYITPGGGTEDYTDLENKPKIGGVELSGDKSLHDLGIAAENAIPDVSGKANLSVVAPAFDQATANDAGSLVTYTDGVVYVLPEGHTAGTTWANTQKTATNIAEQQRLLKNAIHGLEEQLFCDIDKPYDDDEKENILTDSMRSQGSVTNPSSSKDVIYEVPIEANAKMWFVALDDNIILNRFSGNVSIAKDGDTFIPVNIYDKHFSFTSYDVPATLRITLKRKDGSDLSASENVFGNMFLYKTEVKEDVTDLTKLTQGYYSFSIQDRDGAVNSKSFVESTKRVIYTIPINTDSGYQITPPTGCVIREVVIYNNEKGYVYCQTASISKGVFPILKGFGEGDYIQVLLAKSNANDNLSVSECSSIVVEEVK